MTLIAKYLPDYQFSERHTLNIAAPQAAVIAATHTYQPSSDPFFRHMIALRELPMRARGWLRQRHATTAPFGIHNFTLLEQIENRELIFGLAGQFWKLDYGQTPIADGLDFLAFDQPGAAKLVLSFTADSLDTFQTRLTTETRVFCIDRQALRRFSPYWYLIRPVSGLIRRRMLAGIRNIAMHN